MSMVTKLPQWYPNWPSITRFIVWIPSPCLKKEKEKKRNKKENECRYIFVLDSEFFFFFPLKLFDELSWLSLSKICIFFPCVLYSVFPDSK